MNDNKDVLDFHELNAIIKSVIYLKGYLLSTQEESDCVVEYGRLCYVLEKLQDKQSAVLLRG